MQAVFEEFENYVIPPWIKIRNDIQQASAAFVLLSPHLIETPYTQNWVTYEVGLACALNKPVWVYEQHDAPALFPIPYLTDYILYNPGNREHLDAIKRMVESYDPTATLAGLGLGALIGGLLLGPPGAGIGAMIGGAASQPKTSGSPIRCPYPTCGVQYKIYSRYQQLICPACRQVFSINWATVTQGAT